MLPNPSRMVWFAGLVGLVLAAIGLVALYRLSPPPGIAKVPQAKVPREDSNLAAVDARQIRDWVQAMTSPENGDEPPAQLRAHIQELLQNQSPRTAGTMMLAVECLAAKFASLDTSGRQFSLGLMADVLAWHSRNSKSSWGGLLAPAAILLEKALSDPTPGIQLAALKVIGACCSWNPEEADRPAQRKALSTWKAELVERCLDLLDHGDENTRAVAARVIASAPNESTASKSLAFWDDTSPLVRRRLLLALAERVEVLPSEEVLSCLNDPDAQVRSAAYLVLRFRDVTREEIALATRATHPSALVRAQAPRHILETTVVDQLVWLRHLSKDDAPLVRIEVARALAAIGDEACRKELEELAKTDPDTEVQTLAQQLLAQLGTVPPRAPPRAQNNRAANPPVAAAPNTN